MTEDGHVECDASVMDGDSGAFGAVGAVPGTQFGKYFQMKVGGLLNIEDELAPVFLLLLCILVKLMVDRCQKCHPDCCVASQRTDFGFNTSGSNQSYV